MQHNFGSEVQGEPKPLSISDPMERMIADALDRSGKEYQHEVNGLDFYLPGRNVYIEVKRMHSPRIADQMSRAPNVIAVQGAEAVKLLCDLIDAY